MPGSNITLANHGKRAGQRQQAIVDAGEDAIADVSVEVVRVGNMLEDSDRVPFAHTITEFIGVVEREHNNPAGLDLRQMDEMMTAARSMGELGSTAAPAALGAPAAPPALGHHHHHHGSDPLGVDIKAMLCSAAGVPDMTDDQVKVAVRQMLGSNEAALLAKLRNRDDIIDAQGEVITKVKGQRDEFGDLLVDMAENTEVVSPSKKIGRLAPNGHGLSGALISGVKKTTKDFYDKLVKNPTRPANAEDGISIPAKVV